MYWVILPVFFADIILLTLCRYRRRVKQLEAEITHVVNFLAEECINFNNLEYTMQSSDETKLATTPDNNKKFSLLKEEDQSSNSKIYKDPIIMCISDYDSSGPSRSQVIGDHLYDELVKRSEIF